jgi:type I restriction enzyme S subunit
MGWEIYLEHWKADRIKDVCENVVGGGTPKSSISEYWDDGEIIWVSPTDFSKRKGERLITDSEKKITQFGMEKSSATLIPEGTIVMSSRASIGEPKIAGKQITTNQGFISFIAGHKVQNLFLFYCIEGQLGEYFAKIASGTTFMEISRRMAKQEPIPLPSRPEQKAIADYLDKACARIDRIIAIKEEQLRKIEGYFFSRLDEILTCKNNNASGSQRFDQFINREIPKDWNIDRLRDIVIINDLALSNNTPNDFIINYLDISNVNKYGIVDKSDIRELTFEEAPSRARRVTRMNDTVISSVRTNLQAVAYIDFELPNFTSSTGFFVCRPKFASILKPKFLYYFLLSAYSKDFFFSHSTGVSYPAINDYKFGSINIFYPSPEKQEEIIIHLESLRLKVNEMIKKTESQISTLHSYRKSLIHECVTGKKQVCTGEIKNKERATA